MEDDQPSAPRGGGDQVPDTDSHAGIRGEAEPGPSAVLASDASEDEGLALLPKHTVRRRGRRMLAHEAPAQAPHTLLRPP